jgi:prepilin-type processing-associated H-X9-DG protein
MRYRHSGSVNAVMGDGSARSFKKGTVLSSNAKIVQ